MYENLYSVTPFLKPFPAFEDVFGEPIDLHRKHFLPLISADVSVVHPEIKEWLHFVTPIEPLLEGNPGDWTREHHDFYNQVGQIAFRVDQGKYVFCGDFNYFAYESGAIFKAFPNQENEIHADYRRRIESYEQNRQRFLECGRIPWSSPSRFDPTSPDQHCGPLISQLGGEPALGNWEVAGIPTNRNGDAFRYVGEVQGFSYCERGIQAILFFYDPNERIALFRFDWT